MIEVISDAVKMTVAETHSISAPIGIQDWIDNSTQCEDRRRTPLVQVHVNGQILDNYENRTIYPSDDVKIVIMPKAQAIPYIVAVIAAAYAYVQVQKIANFDVGDSEPETANSVYKANLRANTPRLGGLVKEILGTFPTYLDYQVKPHRYYQNNAERLDVALAVGLGEYDIDTLLISETNVDRFAGNFSWIKRDPNQSISDRPEYENWYETEAVKNIELGQEAGATLSDWTGDLSGATLTVRFLGVATPPPFIVGEIFSLPDAPNDGLYRIESVGGVDGNVITAQKVLFVQNYWASTGYYVDDSSWLNFTTETDVAINWNSETGGAPVFGPYTLCPEGESTGIIEIDVVARNGLGEFENDGTISEISVDLEWQFRTEGSTEWTTIRETISGSTRDEVARTYSFSCVPPEISLTGVTASRRDDVAGRIFQAVMTAADPTLWDPINIGDIVSPANIDPNINGAELKVVEIDGADLVMERTDQASVVEEWDTVGDISAGLLYYLRVRPELQIARITPKSTESTVSDEIVIERVKVNLGAPSSYPWTTIGVSLVGGAEISDAAQNKINAVVTRKLPVWDGSTFSGMSRTNDIAPVVAYWVQKCGYDLSVIDLDQLGALDTIWKSRNDSFAGEMNSDLSLLQALELTLKVGFAEPVIESGKIVPYRDVARTNFDYMYTPNQLASSIRATGSLEPTNEQSGYEVEYFDVAEKTPKYVPCFFRDQSPSNLTKVSLVGSTSPITAWRYGMRLARTRYFQPMNIDYSVEQEGFNSGRGTYDAVCGDLAGNAITGYLIAGADASVNVQVDRDLTFGSGTYYILISRPTGEAFSSIVTEGATASELVLETALDFAPDFSGDIDRPSFSFGAAEEFAMPTITQSVQNGGDSVSIRAIEYLPEIYFDDDSITVGDPFDPPVVLIPSENDYVAIPISYAPSNANDTIIDSIVVESLTGGDAFVQDGVVYVERFAGVHSYRITLGVTANYLDSEAQFGGGAYPNTTISNLGGPGGSFVFTRTYQSVERITPTSYFTESTISIPFPFQTVEGSEAFVGFGTGPLQILEPSSTFDFIMEFDFSFTAL